MTTPQLFALISQSKIVSPARLYPIALACEIGAVHCARSWSVQPPAVEVFDDPRKIPTGAFPVVFVDDPNDRGWLGVHYANRTATVFADAGSGLFNGRESISETTSHEVNESTINPGLNQWHIHPTKGVMVAREVCDMVQGSHYTVNVEGAALPVSNFVLPSWFEPGDASGVYDWVGELVAPGQLGVGGYQILRNADNVWHDWAASGAAAAAPPRSGGRVEAILKSEGKP